jgi:hypothetical protein
LLGTCRESRGAGWWLFCLLGFLLASVSAQAAEVALAGFSFAGDFKTAPDRFPNSFALYQQSNAAGTTSFSKVVLDRARALSNPAFEIAAPDSLVSVKKSDQALMAVLVLTGETISSENFGSYHKTFVNLRGDTLIFDFKNKTVVRNYPINVFIFDATPAPPTAEHIRDLVSNLLLREDDNGLVSQFVKRLGAATLPTPGSRNIQIHSTQIAPEALALMPEGLRNDPKTVETMVADSFGSILSAKLGIPLLPAASGHTLGTMSLRLQSGDDIDLRIGEGDYLFDLKLNKFAKIKSGENNLGASYVFGAYANVRFYEPTQNTDFINTDLKNGEVKIVPANQVTNEDFPAYEAALRGLFLKFSDSIGQSDLKWITIAASAKDIGKQVDSARAVIKACK